jgi:amino acid adenylation domain-containing protein
VREHEAARLTTREAEQPFDLAQGPLLRAHLLQLADQEFRLLLTLHHIISDGWSMGLLYREMAGLYRAYVSGNASALGELAIQYADFAAWQRNWLEEEAQQGHLAYWQRQLGNAPVSLQLPTDRPRPALQTFSGGVESLVLPASLATALKALSLQADVTLFMTLLAAWQTLLWRYTGQDDICVGTFIAGRNHAEIEGLIGFFLNNLALRTNLAGNPPFRQLLERVRTVTLDAYAHQDVPFERILQELGWKHDPQTTPLFQVMLILQNMPEPLLEIPGLLIREAGEWSTRVHFDLSLWVVEARDHIRMDLQYNTDIYGPHTMQRMLKHLHVLLQAIVDHPQQRLGDLPLLTAEEQRQRLAEWSTDTREQASERGLHHFFEEQVQLIPHAVALVWEEQHFTYAAVNQQANRLAHYLRSLGVAAETHVGICLPRCALFIIGLLAILKAGGAHVSLDPTYPQERLALMMDALLVPILLTQTALLPALPAYAGRILCLDTVWPEIERERSSDPRAMTVAQHIAYTIYTSGSTGIPKGVEIQHGTIVGFIETARPAYACVPGDRVLQFCSLSFDTSIEEIYICLSSGATLVLRTDEMLSSIAFFLHQCQQQGITVLDLPTAFWHEMVAHLEHMPQHTLAAWRLVLLGGERVEPAKVAGWQQWAPPHIQLVNTYGPTEATVISTLHTIEATPVPGPGSAIPLGKAIANVRLAILDSTHQFAPPGIWGELAIGGTNLARGYLNQPALTAEKFIPDPLGAGARLYRSGDFARVLADGTLEFGGRCDDQVKLRGFRVELSEIEYALQFHPALADAVVKVYEQGDADRILLAYLVWRQPQSSTIDEVRAYLKTLLPEYMIPTGFQVLERLPLLPNVKVDYNALPPPDKALATTPATLVEARDALELQLVQIWEECLHVHPIGISDNFFELGGHSLLAVRLLSQIHRHFKRQLPLASLLQRATIEQLASLLRQQPESHTKSLLVGIQTQGSERPLFLMHPTGGNVLCYASLAYHLGKNQPVYGLQAQGLEGEEEPLNSMEEMAHIYLQVLRTQQPQGPYRLGGWSSGGLLAMEVALQLHARGQEVDLLVLFDAPALFATWPAGITGAGDTIANDTAAALARFIFQLNEGKNRDIPQIYAELCQLSPEAQSLYVLDQARSAHVIPADADSSFINRLIRVYDADSRATVRYQPRVYAGRIVYIQSEEATQETIQAWRTLAADGLDLFAAPGDHVGMLKEPHVTVVAERVRTCLAAQKDAHRASASREKSERR